MSADVFGAIIGSPEDADAVGQIYGEMASNMDYICPMIYPSYYGDGNFGLDHPDLHPYETVLGALKKSAAELKAYGAGGVSDGSAAGAAATASEADEKRGDGAGKAADTAGRNPAGQTAAKGSGQAAAGAAAADAEEPEQTAIVRPWLQDFTASYLKHYQQYGNEELREQIEAVYDAGYEEWILWNAANKYHYGGLLNE